MLVPSPTTSPVFSAACRSICAPRFSSGSFELEFLGDGHAVVADERRAPFLLDQHRLRFRSERDANGVGELGRAAQDLFARRGAEQDLLVGHGWTTRVSKDNAWQTGCALPGS